MKRNGSESRGIHQLLKRTEISPDTFTDWILGHEEEMHHQLIPIYSYLDKRAPKKLFRLRQFSDNSVEALLNDQIFFSRGDWFNDPYDCLLYFDDHKLQNRIRNYLTAENMRDFLGRSDIHFPINEEFRTMDDFLHLCEANKDEFLASVYDSFSSAVGMLQKGTYIACFTERVDSPVMWAHYANSHKGFAIEYQFEPSFFYPSPHFPGDDRFDGYGWRSLLPVYYSKYRADATKLVDWFCLCEMRKQFSFSGTEEDCSLYLPDMLLKTKLSLQKSEIWAYEKEWRLIITHEWPNDIGSPIIHIERKASGVYLGERMEGAHKQQLIRIAQEKSIPVYEMYIDNSSREYEMKYRQIH